MSYEACAHAAVRSSLQSAYKVEINMATEVQVPVKFRKKICIGTEDAKGDRKKENNRALLLPLRLHHLALITAHIRARMCTDAEGR